MVPPGAVGVLPGRLGPRCVRRPCGWRWLIAGNGRRPGLCQPGAVRGDALLDGLGEVLPQVEPVSDLDRVRCPGACPVRVGAGAVPADDLDAGMRGQPVRERLRVAALQQVKRRPGLAVDDDRAVVLPAPDGEVVHPEDPRGGRRRVRGGHDEPEQHLPARRHSHGQGPMPSRTGRLTRRPQGSRTPDRTCTVTACRSCLTSRRTRRSWNTCGSRPARLADLMTTPWAPGSCAATRT